MRILLVSALALGLAMPAMAQRTSEKIKNWKFSKDKSRWENVTVPHDWAISGPFSRDNDLQRVAVEQNGEKEETLKTGRTGGLPSSAKGRTARSLKCPTRPDAPTRSCLTVR